MMGGIDREEIKRENIFSSKKIIEKGNPNIIKIS